VGLYADFARKSFRQRLTYRSDAFIGVIGAFVLLSVQVSVWHALYATRSSQDGITLPDMVTYVILGMLMNRLTNSFVQLRIAERMEDGTIANDFVRPINFKFYMIAEDLGENAMLALMRCLPACLFGAFYWGLKFPEESRVLLLALLAGLGGFILSCQLNYTLGLCSFWFKSSHHIDWFFGALYLIFSGWIVPLWFYPPGLRALSEALPWQLMSFAPLAIYLGKVTLPGALRVLLLQALWFVVLLVAERLLWRRAQDRIEVYGG
jgi:ABC-2 type transport system permease protein